MSSSHTKTWDLSKRFLKHSEALLLANPKAVEDLILLYLKALKEVLGPKDFGYLWGETGYGLEKQKLVSPAPAPPSVTGLEELPLSPALEDSVPHRVWFYAAKLSGPKRHFLNLITQVYKPQLGACLEALGQGSKAQAKAEALRTQRANSLRAKYRRQKEVILAIERFAKKQNLGLLKEIQELPELEQEIIHFQNQLLSDLEKAKADLSLEREKNRQTQLFLGQLLDELANKLRITLGILEFLPSDPQRGGTEAKAGSLVGARLAHLVELCEGFAENLEGQNHPNPIHLEEFTALEMVHLSLGLFSRADEVRGCEFSFAQTLGQLKVRGDLGLLGRGLAQFYRFVVILQEWQSEAGHLKFSLKGKRVESGLELRIEVLGLNPSLEVQGLWPQGHSIFENRNPALLIPALVLHQVTQTFERQGGRVALLWREAGRLDLRLTLGEPPQN